MVVIKFATYTNRCPFSKNIIQISLKVLPKLKHEGILIIDNINLYLPNASRSPNSIRRFDNTNDSDWASVQVQIDSWEMVWTTNGVSDTALWIKP